MTHAPGLEKSTRARIATCLFLSALIGIPRFFTVSAANLLFLEHHPATDLPYAYAASAIVIATVGFLYMWMERRVGFLRTSVWGAGTLALAFAATRLGYETPGGKSVASFAMVLLAEVEFSFCSLAFWGVANRLFNVREAGRIFGVIGAGEIVPSLCGGLFLEEIVGRIGLSNLLWGTVFGQISIAGALVILGRLAAGWLQKDASATGRTVSIASNDEDIRSKFRDPLFLLVASLLFLGVVSTYWVDNAFLFSLQEQFPNQDERARFLGRFFVALGMANLAFKFVLAHRWKGWLGGRKTLQSTPLCVLGVALVIVVFPLLIDAPHILVWLVILLKLSERVLLESVNNPAFYSLFQAFPVEVRAQLQGKMETVVAQGATLFAGVFVLAVGAAVKVDLSHLLLLVCVVSICWIISAHFSWRSYVDRILFALQERQLHPGFVEFESEAARTILHRGLQSREPAKIVFSLRKLDEVNDETHRHQVSEICEHEDVVVMDAACGVMERRGWRAEAEQLAEKWPTLSQGEKHVRARWLRTFALLLPQKSRSLLMEELDDDSHTSRIGACIGILQAGKSRLRAKALECLVDEMRVPRAADRESVWRALPNLKGNISTEEERQLGAPLLDYLRQGGEQAADEQAAIRAVAAFSMPDLWQEVLSRLSRPECRESIVDTLVMGGAPAIMVLIRFLQALPDDDDTPVRGPATVLLARIGDEKCIDEILRQMTLLSSYDRRPVLAALPPRDFVPSFTQRNLLRQLVAQERAELDSIGSTWWSLLDAGAPQTVLKAVREEWEESVCALLQLVGVSTGKYNAQFVSHFWGTPVEDRALALEYLEAEFRDTEQVWLMSLLERNEPLLPAVREGTQIRSTDPARAFDMSSLQHRYSGVRAWLLDFILGSDVVAPDARPTFSDESHLDVPRRLEMLSGVEAFAKLKTMELAAWARKAEWVELAADEVWQAPDTGSTFVAAIARGSLHLHHATETWVRSEGEYFGNGWLAARKSAEPAIHMAKALEPTLLLWVMDSVFSEMCAEAPAAAWRILEGLAATVQGAAKSIVHDTHRIPRELRGVTVRRSRSADTGIVLEKTLALRGIALFQNLDDASLLAVAQAAHERYLEPGEYLCGQGDDDANLLIVLEGNATVSRGETVLAQLEGPCILGELGAITAAPRVATVQAVTFCRVLQLERAAFYDLVIRHRPMTTALRDLLVSMKKPDVETSFFSHETRA